MTQQRMTETYKNFSLVAAFHKGTFRGRAYKNGETQFEVEGSDLEDVIATLRSKADDILTALSRRREKQPISSPEYVAAMRTILKNLSDGQLAMLKAHYYAPNRTLTATQLAEAAGYQNFSAANLQYGLLGRWLAEELLCVLPARDDGTPIYTFALATSPEAGQSEHEWQWALRPEVAAAIEELGLDC